ncbi:MAG: group III truncated hemoglobin [Pyrinomonadaceae bacterium]|nr:group III truncated hemoglobin [Pyrinomonadaceae bacterium]
MPDIETRKDIEKLLQDFYTTAMKDELIGHHFVDLDLKSHLPVITDFWVKVLFREPVYFGNPMLTHKILHDKSKLESAHFSRWVEIFAQKVDSMFTGEFAEMAKERAQVVARSLNARLNEDEAVYTKIV